MAVEEGRQVSVIDSDSEIHDLQRDLFAILWPLAVFVSCAWLVYVLSTNWSLVMLGLNLLPAVVVILGSYLASRLCSRLPHLAYWLQLILMALFVGMLSGIHPQSYMAAFGVIIIILANALLGAAGGVVTTLGMWGAVPLARFASTGEAWADPVGSLQLLILYALTLGASWLSIRPLNMAITWTRSSWQQARKALTEVQQRRAELYRVVRALEEATYRMARMNNELTIAQEEAEAARALKARFVATISHEIRGPLNLILGFSRMMALFPERYDEPLPKAYQEDVDTVYRNSQHLLALVDDILDLSQIEAQKLPLVKDLIDLDSEVISKTTAIVQPLAARKGVALHQQVAGHLPLILADPVRLRQVLLNLLTNAVRFTNRGTITVRAEQEQENLQVSVQDTGQGIPKEDLPRLFREFQRVNLTETREQGGSGLGLSICKQLVELHGGHIWAESEPGVGTRITFTLPLRDPVVARMESLDTGRTDRPRPATRTCLVVHDDPAIIRLLNRHIEGYEMVGIADADQVLALAEKLHPRAIITNHFLADSIAAEFAQTPYDVPIVSWTMEDTREQARSPKLSYLLKPIVPEAVAAVMQEIDRDGEISILLVDDEPDAVRLLEGILMALPHPYKILRAYNGAQALDLMRTQVPDIMFLDLVMPELDGEGTLAAMRSDEILRQVPVVLVSGQDVPASQAALGSPIVIRHRRPLDMAHGARCLQGILDALAPHYLPATEQTAWF